MPEHAARIAYLDHAATTPMHPAAVAVMLPFLSERFANPHGAHAASRDARRAVDEARDQIAAALGVEAGEIVVTSGGTESDNSAISGVLRRRGGIGVCSAAEHAAVLEPIRHGDGVVVPTTSIGTIDLDALADSLTPAVSIVSVMAVNNEVGSISPVADVAALVRERAPGAVLHCDAVQALAWLDVAADVVPHVDLVSFSAHKVGGPKGVGVLVQHGGVALEPLLRGGGQERDRRSGTLNVPGIVATAVAFAETVAGRAERIERVGKLRDRLLDGLLVAVDGLSETVPRALTAAGHAHVCVPGVESEALLYLLDQRGVMASAGSACASGAVQVSHVLAAMGVADMAARGALRLTLGATSTDADVDQALEAVAAAVAQCRKLAVR